MWAKDASGNISAAATSQAVVLDTTAPVPNIYLTSPENAQNSSVTLTAGSCSDVSSLYITESLSEVPLGTEGSWQSCSTTANAITYTLSSTTVGSHPLYIWAKDAVGNISTSSKMIPLKYVPKFVLGQADMNSALNWKIRVHLPNMIKKIGSKFYLSSGLAQISVYSSVPSTNLPVPDYFLGQSQATIASTGRTGPSNFNSSVSFDSDGTRLVVSDTSSNRVLIWNQLPTDPSVPADIVLGQSDFYSILPNNGKGISTGVPLTCADLYTPTAVKISGSSLYVADSNNRVLVWSSWPTSNNQAADLVLGQSNCGTRVTTPVSAASMNTPRWLNVIGSKLIVSDTVNNRVLIWNSLPTVSGQVADLVLGQSNFTGTSANSGGVSASTLNSPRGIESDGSNLIVADYGNNRVLVWSAFPTASNQAASVVIGQSTFTGITANQGGPVADNTLNTPFGVSIIDGDLWVTDMSNSRVLKFSGVPSSNGTSAIFQMGQQSFVQNYQSMGSGTTSQTVNRPRQVDWYDGSLVVASYGASRLMWYNNMPIGNNPAADWQWGQDNFNTDQGNRGVTLAANTLASPVSILVINGKFFISDGYSRILGFLTIPTSNSSAPDFILGQSGFTSGVANNGGRSASTLANPIQLASDGQKLAVADSGNHRVLIWNTIPTSTQVPADIVLGQSSMTTGAANAGGISAATLNAPVGVLFAENKLIVSDSGNNRILIWNSIPATSGTPADIVIGQVDMISNKSYNTNTGISSLQRITPQYLSYSNGKLIVSDSNTGTLRIWNSIPTTNQQNPDIEYGVNVGTGDFFQVPTPITEYVFSAPYSAKSDGYRLVIPDYSLHRVIAVPLPEVSLASAITSNDRNTTLSLINCTNRAYVMFNEGGQPSSSDSSWQSCTTTSGTYSYTTTAGDGLKTIKIWFKDSDGNVSPNYQVVPRWLITQFNVPAVGTLSAGSLTNNLVVTYTPIGGSKYYLSESSTTPSVADPNWQDVSGTISLTLSNQTDGVRNIYIWEINEFGNISQHPLKYTFTYDASPPTAPTTTLDGYYLASYSSLMRLTVSSCADAMQVAVTETNVAPASGASSWVTCTTATQGINYTMTSATEGNHTLYVWAKDNAGNISTSAYQVSANFNTNLVLGQNDSQSVSNAATSFNGPRDISSDGTNFAVADTYNGRVLLYPGDPTQNAPSIVLGQSSLTKVGCLSGGTVNASTLCQPFGVVLVPVGGGVTKLIVADYYLHRVLIWNTLPTSNNQAADVVVGQADMATATLNTGGISCARLRNPAAVASDGTRLLIADYGNNRALLFNAIPTANGATANVVIGQASCVLATSNLSQSGTKGISGVAINGTQLAVTDQGNNRVLLFNSIPTSHGANADYVVGQPNFVSSSGLTTATGMSQPQKVHLVGGKMYVGDYNNSRLLIYNSVPAANGVSANIALGKANLTSTGCTYTAAGGCSIYAAVVGSSYIWTIEASNRIKRYPVATLATGMSPDAFAGVSSLTDTITMNSRTTTTTSSAQLTAPWGAVIIGTKLVVSDTNNNRILIWNALPTSSNQAADVVLGQANFTTVASGATSSALNGPAQVFSDGTRLIVADKGNNRVLIWNSVPTVNNTAADLVLGQANFTTGSANRGGSVAGNSMSSPSGGYTDGSRLYIADTANHRILVWTTFPTANGQTADFVLGQANLTTGSSNRGGTVAANSLSNPTSVIEASSKLIVADPSNNRALVWNSIPSSTGVAADVAIGEPNLTSSNANVTTTIFRTTFVRYLNSRLYLIDGYQSRRISVYNSIPTSSGAAVDSIIGQNQSTTNLLNNTGLSSWTVSDSITDMLYSGGYYWIVDQDNHRVVKVSMP